MKQRKLSPRILILLSVAILTTSGIGGAAIAWAGQSRGNSIVESVQATGRNAAAAAPSTQQGPLADGVVSDAEYDSAVEQTVACLVSRGVRPETQPRSGKRPPSIGLVVQTLEEGEAARKELDTCKTQFLSAIDAVYRAQFLVSQQQLEDGNQWIGGCLAAKGYQVPSGPVSYDQILAWREDPNVELREAVVMCSIDRRAALGF